MEFVIIMCLAWLSFVFIKGINFISDDLIDIKKSINELTKAIKDRDNQ